MDKTYPGGYVPRVTLYICSFSFCEQVDLHVSIKSVPGLTNMWNVLCPPFYLPQSNLINSQINNNHYIHYYMTPLHVQTCNNHHIHYYMTSLYVQTCNNHYIHHCMYKHVISHYIYIFIGPYIR